MFSVAVVLGKARRSRGTASVATMPRLEYYPYEFGLHHSSTKGETK